MKACYYVVEIYRDSFWRIKTPLGRWMHVDNLPLSFTDKKEAEDYCRVLNERETE